MLVRVYKKLSRNAICKCGSGKKIKNCSCEDMKVLDDMLDKASGFVTRDGIVVGEWEKNK